MQDVIVVAAGLGNAQLGMKKISVRAAAILYLPHCSHGPSIHLTVGGLIIIPAPRGRGILCSIFGGQQPYVERNYRGALPYSLVEEVYRKSGEAGLDTKHAYIYPCVKVEVRSPNADRWGVSPYPNYSEIDSSTSQHVLSCIPGKWSLAYHATDRIIEVLGYVPIEPVALRELLVEFAGKYSKHFVTRPAWDQANSFNYC